MLAPAKPDKPSRLWFLMDLAQGSTGRTGNFPAPAHKINFRLTHYRAVLELPRLTLELILELP